MTNHTETQTIMTEREVMDADVAELRAELADADAREAWREEMYMRCAEADARALWDRR